MAVETSSECGEPLLGETIRDKEKRENIRSQWDPNDFALPRVGMGTSGHVGRCRIAGPTNDRPDLHRGGVWGAGGTGRETVIVHLGCGTEGFTHAR